MNVRRRNDSDERTVAIAASRQRSFNGLLAMMDGAYNQKSPCGECICFKRSMKLEVSAVVGMSRVRDVATLQARQKLIVMRANRAAL